MKCPQCHSNTHVVNSNQRVKGFAVRRQRECLSCSYVFVTMEIAAAVKPPKAQKSEARA